jgi:type I restriction enzyme S subunit
MSEQSFMEKLLDGVAVGREPLGEVIDLEKGKQLNKELLSKEGKYPAYNGGITYSGFTDRYNYDGNTIIISQGGASAGFVNFVTSKFYANAHCYVVLPKAEVINNGYVYHFLKLNQERLTNGQHGAGIPALKKSEILDIPIPIPCPDNPAKSLKIQKEIVRILDTFTELTTELATELATELTNRKKQYNYYRDQLLTFDEGDVEWKAFGEVFNIFAGGDKPKEAISDVETEDFRVPILSNGIGNRSLYGWTNKAKIMQPSLTVSARGTIGWASYRDRPFFPIIRLIVLTPKLEINLKYAYYFMKTIEKNYKVPEAGIPQLTKPMIKDTQFPIPFPDDPVKSLAEQARIVAILDKFDTRTNSISEGLPKEIELREKQYAYYRDLLFNFPNPEGVN